MRHLGFFTASGIDKKFLETEILTKMVNYTDIYGNGKMIIEKTSELKETTASSDKIKEHSLKKGDILFTPSSETEKDIGVSAVVMEDMKNIVYSYHLIRFRPAKDLLNIKFSKYFCNNNFVLNQFSSLCTGTTRMVVGREDFKSIKILLPKLSEQDKMANFLDDKVFIIEQIIDKKQKLIEFLREERTAVINHAVTKGLDSRVEFVESGVEWIGKIPKGWKVKKLKFLGEAIIGLTYSPEELVTGTGTLVLRSSNVQKDEIKLNDNVYVNKIIPSKLITRIGDILICSRNGSRSLIGKNAVIDKNSVGLSFGAFMTVFRTKHSRFISYFLKSNLFMSQLSTTLTSTINQLTTHYLNNIITAIPSEYEQEKISSYLDEKIDAYDRAIDYVGQSIEKLKEFKSSLISNVVTGKIKV